MSVWTSCCCLAFLPLGFRSLRNTYSGISIFKGMANECTMLEFVVMLMMLAGIALRLFSWGGLVLGFEGEYVAAILLVIAIGWAYRQSKKFAQELQATNGLTTVAGWPFEATVCFTFEALSHAGGTLSVASYNHLTSAYLPIAIRCHALAVGFVQQAIHCTSGFYLHRLTQRQSLGVELET